MFIELKQKIINTDTVKTIELCLHGRQIRIDYINTTSDSFVFYDASETSKKYQDLVSLLVKKQL